MKNKHAGLILAALICGHAYAAPDFSQLERWKSEVKGEEYSAGAIDTVEAETAGYLLVRQDAGRACPAGSFWLFNKKQKSYKPVDAGTCAEGGFKVLLDKDKLLFKVGKKVTAQYPVY